jgi:hypothetical protein
MVVVAIPVLGMIVVPLLLKYLPDNPTSILSSNQGPVTRALIAIVNLDVKPLKNQANRYTARGTYANLGPYEDVRLTATRVDRRENTLLYSAPATLLADNQWKATLDVGSKDPTSSTEEAGEYRVEARTWPKENSEILRSAFLHANLSPAPGQQASLTPQQSAAFSEAFATAQYQGSRSEPIVVANFPGRGGFVQDKPPPSSTP